MCPPLRQRLTEDDMSAITAVIGAAATPGQALLAALQATFDALLAPAGESTRDYGPQRRLHVQNYALPADQWRITADTLLTTPVVVDDLDRIVLVTEWANYGPNYDEALGGHRAAGPE